MNYNILTGEHISKKYGNNHVLRDVSIHIKQGEIYGLIGKNGSGKTTLLRILCGLIPNYGGKITLANIGSSKCKIAALINSPALFLNMTAFENLKEQSALLGLHNDTKINDILKTIGLEDNANKVVKGFSLGMTQRLKLGMALLESPDLFILDEPVNGLDPDGIAALRELLHQLNKEYGMTILISSHILGELEHTATCFGILNDGVIIKELSIHDIQQSNSTLEKLYMQYTKGGNEHNA
ncbi:MAG: ATP-binding cassette domain-containing protein [Bacteroidales bacterium]|nr:ATP-binding cassette domain-containing protein [Bacteroidales bacterium]